MESVKQLSGYLSHLIRGRNVEKATQEEREANMRRSCVLGQAIRKTFSDKIKLYIPAEQDIFPSMAMKHNVITIEDVLYVDGLIIQQQDFLVVNNWDNYISAGMEYEIMIAQDYNIPIFEFIGDPTKEQWDMFYDFLSELWLNKYGQPMEGIA